MWFRQILVVLVCLWGTALQAADFRLLELTGRPVKWGEPHLGTGATITYAYVHEHLAFSGARNCRSLQPLSAISATSGIVGLRLEASFEAAFDLWEEVADLQFVHTARLETADILIGAQGHPRGVAYANVWEEATDSVGNANTIIRALICLNPQVEWQTERDYDSTTFNVKRVAAHEIGHVIGLDHPGPGGQLMGFRYDEGLTSLGLGDVRGAIKLYGQPKPSSRDW